MVIISSNSFVMHSGTWSYFSTMMSEIWSCFSCYENHYENTLLLCISSDLTKGVHNLLPVGNCPGLQLHICVASLEVQLQRQEPMQFQRTLGEGL